MARAGIVISEKDAGSLCLTKPNRYVLFREIYPKLNLDSIKNQEAKAMLTRHYIKAFGPVTEEDIAWWTGFTKTIMKEALVTMEKKLLYVKINGANGEYVTLASDYEQLLKFKSSTAPPALLLPYEDPFTKGYKTRARLVDKEHEKKVYIGGGVQPTILINGKVAGTWSRNIEEGKGPIKLPFFRKTDKKCGKNNY